MVYADLHVHTTVSDGALAPESVPSAAQEADLEVIAITDHDRLNDTFEEPVLEIAGVTVINGIELRVDPEDGERIDLLGYGITPTDALHTEIDRLQSNRAERGASIVTRVEEHLDVTLDVDIGPGIGRPHIARAVVDHPETTYETTDSVFADLIGEDGPCFVPRDLPSFERGVTLLKEACHLVALAHPLRYDEPDAALDRCGQLDAVERHYPYERPVETAPVQRALDRYDLLATGGSDAHDEEVGTAGLTKAAFEPVRQAIPGA